MKAQHTVLLVGTLFGATQALPCRFITETLTLTSVPDAVVPLNVVWLAPRTDPYDRHAWWIREEGTEGYERMTIAFDDDVTRVSPDSPLSPATSYELLLTRHDDGVIPPQPFDDELARVEGGHTVTTADADDDESPPAPEIVDVVTEAFWGDDNDCGVAPAGTSVIIRVASNDETYALRLERTDGSSKPRISLDPHNGAPANADGAPIADFADDESGVLDYRVVAIDNAGNESEPVNVSADVGLPGACASTNAMPFALVAFFVLLARRSWFHPRQARCKAPALDAH
jgi:hypothetical protein